jgi:hypothetical protein
MGRSYFRTISLAASGLVLALASACSFGNDVTTGADGGFDVTQQQSAAVLVAQPATQDFGTVTVGSQSAAADVTVSNAGGGPSGALSVSVSGGAFGIDADACSGHSLDPSATCVVKLHFAPSSAGAQSGTLTVSGAQTSPIGVTLSGTGADNGSLSLTPGTQDFGAVGAGATSKPTTFTVKNGGTAKTGAVSLSVTGQDSAAFQLGNDSCSGKTLAGGASCTVDVTFAPTASGAATATLTAQAAGAKGTATASLSGTGGAPASFAMTPSTYDFGSIGQGSTSAQQTFTVKNTGGSASGTVAVTIDGPNAKDFALASNGCTAAVQAGATCTFALAFTPSSAAAEAAKITVSAPSVTPVTAAVTGTGLPPSAIAVGPSTHDFGAVAQGAASPDVAFVVTNGGGVATGTLAVSLAGTDAAQFALGTDGCSGTTLAAAASCTVQVHFTPTTSGNLGSVQASLLVSGTPGGTTSSTLTGTTVPPATVALGTTSQAFGSVVQQTSSGDVPLTVTNQGGTTSGPLSVAISGPDAAQFGAGSLDSCTGQTLAPGATCQVSVHFLPDASALGTKQATLTVSATPGGSSSASLTGTAVTQAAITVTPTSQTWGTIVQGSASSTVQFVFANTGGVATGPLTSALGGANGGQFAITDDQCVGRSLPLNTTCAVSVHFAPTMGTLGAQQATLTVGGNPGGFSPVSLIGTAATPLQINPTTQGFGIAAFGSPSAPIPFTVTNTSASSVGPLAVSLQGPQGAQFQVGANSTCAGKTLAANGTCTVYVTLSPTSGTTGAMAATLLVGAGAGTSQQTTLSGTAVKSATLGFSATSQPFGDVVQGTNSGDVTLTVTNSGGVPTGSLQAALSGTNASQFGLGTDGCSGNPLAAGASCTVNVHFAPTASTVGQQQATLTLTGTPGGAPTVALTGNAVTPAALGITGTGGLGTVVQGSASADSTFTVTNAGGVATGALAVALGGAQPGQFKIASDGCSGQKLAANGGTCQIKAHFAPALGTLGGQQATLTATASPGGSAPVTLVGTAATPLSMTPTSQPFPDAAFGSPSGPLTFTVTNASASAVGPLTASLGGAAGTQYQLAGGTCVGATLAGGGSATCTVGVTFSPGQGVTGPQPATLTVSLASVGANTSTASNLSGNAVSPATLGISGNGGFGTIVQGQSSGDVGFTVTNSGGVATGTLHASLGGTNLAQFGLGTDGCSNHTLAPGASCTVYAHFSPQATVTGTQSASLGVTGTPGGSAALALSGNAVTQAALAISGNGAFGPVVAGSTSATTTFTVTNNGGVATGALTVSSLSAPFAIVSNGCSAALAPGGNCSITAKFAPALGLLGAQQTTLTVSSSPGGSAPASLTGTATTPLSVSPGSNGFGTVAWGTSSATATFTVKNLSASSLPALNVGLLGTNPGQFRLGANSNCAGAVLAAGATCTEYVTMVPTQGTTGALSAVLDVNAGTNMDVQATLSGTAANPANLVLTPAGNFDFGSVVAGSNSGVRTYTLQNTGGVTSGSLELYANSSEFAITASTCSAANGGTGTLAPGGTCTFGVYFKPTVAIFESCTLSATASPGGSPSLTLSGTGTPNQFPLGITVYNGTCSGGFCSTQCGTIPLTLSGTYSATVDASGGATSTGGTYYFPSHNYVGINSSITVAYAPPTGTQCTCSLVANNIHAECPSWGCPLTILSNGNVTTSQSATIYCEYPIQ